MLPLLVGCGDPLGVRPLAHPDRVVAAAAPVLAAMEARRVDFLRDQGWCRALSYDRGDFVVTSHPSTCVLDAGFVGATPLDATADADLRGWADALAGAGAEVDWVTVAYGEGGPIGAELALSGFARRSLVWAPADPPEDLGSEQQVDSIPGQPGWYVVLEDWN